MRWPFRRRDLPLPDPAPIPVPLTVTVWSRPPILLSDTFGLPDVAGTRSLLPRHDGSPASDAPRGRVFGAVAVPRGIVRRPGWLAVLRHRLAGRAPVAPVADQPWRLRVLERPAPPPPSLMVAAEDPPENWIDVAEPPQPVRQAVPGQDQSGWINGDAIAELRSILDIARDQPGPVSRPPVEPADAGGEPTPRRLSLAESRRIGISRARPEPPTETPDLPAYLAIERPKPADPPAETPSPTAAPAETPKPADVAAEGPSPAGVVAEEPTPPRIAAETPKPTGVAAGRPKRAGIVAERPQPVGSAPESGVAAEGPADAAPAIPKRANIAAERLRPVDATEMPALPADVPAALPVEVAEVLVAVAAAPDLPANMAAGPLPAEALADVAAETAQSAAAPPPGYVVIETSRPAEPVFEEAPARETMPDRLEPLALPGPAVDLPKSRDPASPLPATRSEPARRFGLGVPLPPGARRVVDQVTKPTQRTERPPDDLTAMVGAAHGVDLSGTWVHRGTEVTARADAMGARAFTAAGTVYLPDTAGPLATVETRATLAHELTHVAQQQTLGTALPAEWTPAGQALESEAVLAQRWVLAGQSGPPLVHAPVARALTAPESTSDGVQRQPLTELSWRAPDEMLAQFASQAEAPTTTLEPSNSGSAVLDPTPAAQTMPTQLMQTQLLQTQLMPEAPPDEPVPRQQEWVVDLELVERRDRLLALCAQRPANLDNVLDMEELAVKLYHRLRGLLRGELIVDRERAGLLTDFR